MAVSLGSLDRVDRQVVDALRQLAEAVNALEARLDARARVTTASEDAQARAAAKLVEQQVQQVGKDLRALTARVAALEP